MNNEHSTLIKLIFFSFKLKGNSYEMEMEKKNKISREGSND